MLYITLALSLCLYNVVAHDLLEYRHMDDVCLGKLVLYQGRSVRF